MAAVDPSCIDSLEGQQPNPLQYMIQKTEPFIVKPKPYKPQTCFPFFVSSMEILYGSCSAAQEFSRCTV